MAPPSEEVRWTAVRAYAGEKGALTFEQFSPRDFGPADVGILSARSLFLLFSNEAAGLLFSPR